MACALKTLIIDTSHERSLVAFADGEEVLLTSPLPVGLQSSAHLFPLLKAGFHALDWRPEGLDALVVATGPGSFTGIRVGAAAAKGLAAPRGIPLIGVCSLYGFVADGLYAAVIDARMGGLFFLLPGGVPQRVPLDALPPVDLLVGPHLGRIPFPRKVETYPDPAELLRQAVGRSGGDDLDLWF